jgi:membrane-associated protein
MRRFVAYSAIGGVIWATGVTLLGFWLGQVSLLADHLELVLVALVALSLIPIVVETRRARPTGAQGNEPADGADTTGVAAESTPPD